MVSTLLSLVLDPFSARSLFSPVIAPSFACDWYGTYPL